MSEPGAAVAATAPADSAAARVAAIVVPLAATGLLAFAAHAAGTAGVAVVVLVLQVPLVLAWLALSGATGTGGGAVLAGLAIAAADLALAADDEATTRALAPVLGLALLGAFAHQLVRGRRRTGATASLAAEISAVVIAAAAACWLALRALPLGEQAVTVTLAAVAAGLVAGRAVDLLAPGPKVVPGGLRGPVGAAAALVAAVAAGALAGAATDGVGQGNGALLAFVVAVGVVTTDLAVDMIAASLPTAAFRARSAVPAVAGLLPLVAAAPAAYVAARVLLS